MGTLPTGSVAVEIVALLVASSVPVPKGVLFAEKVTVPVGPLACELADGWDDGLASGGPPVVTNWHPATLAVKVTFAFCTCGLALEETAVDEQASEDAKLKFCDEGSPVRGGASALKRSCCDRKVDCGIVVRESETCYINASRIVHSES